MCSNHTTSCPPAVQALTLVWLHWVGVSSEGSLCQWDGHPAAISPEWQGHTWGGGGEGEGRGGWEEGRRDSVSPYTHPLSFFAAILKMMAGLLVVSMCALASWACDTTH